MRVCGEMGGRVGVRYSDLMGLRVPCVSLHNRVSTRETEEKMVGNGRRKTWRGERENIMRGRD